VELDALSCNDARMHDRVDRRTHDVYPGVPPNSLQPRTRPRWLGLCIDVGYVSNTNLVWESGEALFEVLR
jgi:hypothetical protein